MEALCAVGIFSRGEANYQLQYLHCYGDGDSKSFTSVQNIYPGYKVIKYEMYRRKKELTKETLTSLVTGKVR